MAFHDLAGHGQLAVAALFGGQIHDKVKQGTSYLVAGEKVGKAKLDSAKKHGTKVISETELAELLAGGAP